MSNILYLGIINDSNEDRCKSILSQTKGCVLNILWEDYLKHHASDVEVASRYADIHEFEKAASSEYNSAYIQKSDSHINYELHEVEV